MGGPFLESILMSLLIESAMSEFTASELLINPILSVKTDNINCVLRIFASAMRSTENVDAKLSHCSLVSCEAHVRLYQVRFSF